MDAEEKRIHKILGDDYERTLRNAERYRQYLLTKIGLSWLTSVDEDDAAHTLLRDYGVWHTNY